SHPMGIALLRDGRLLVADTRNQRLRVVEIDGRVGTWAGTGMDMVSDGAGASLFTPIAVAAMPSGDALIFEANTGLLRKVAGGNAHEVSTVAGNIGRTGWSDGPLATATFSETFSIAVRADGQIILVDGATARIR